MDRLQQMEIEASKKENSCGSCASKKSMFCSFPNSITLSVTNVAGDGVTGGVFKDACGLFDSLGVSAGASAENFEVRGDVTAENVRKYLQTHRGRIAMINYECKQDPSQLTQKIKLISTSIDETQNVEKIFDVATDVRNSQFQDGLITIYPKKGEAWLTNTSGIVMAMNDVSAKTVNLTIQFDAWESYTDIACN